MSRDNFPIGLLVKVEKNVEYRSNDNRSPEIRGLAIGYYDSVRMRPIKHWFDFSPDHLHDGNDGSSYLMKLCFPSQEIREKLEKKGLCYECWVDDLPKLVRERPCVSVVLINLMDSFKYPEDSKNHIDLFSDGLIRLTELLDISSEIPQDVSCCILPSLGYSDYGILFAEKSWNTALNLMSKLHQIKDCNGKPVLSSDYSIPAYFAKEVPADTTLFPDKVQLATRLALKPGYTPMHILKAIDGKRVHVFEINDTADCLLISKSHPEYLLSQLLHIRDFTDGESEIPNMVISSKSRLHREILSADTPPLLSKSEIQFHELKNLISSLKKYRDRMFAMGKNLRQANALLETASSLMQVCRQPHNRDLKEGLSPLIYAFTRCMESLVHELERDPSQFEPSVWQAINQTLDSFRERVGGFVSDLTRSDSFFMEREQYNHPSVGSGTMLLLGLNRIINELSQEIQIDSGYSQSKHGFLLTSGGCDNTQTHRLFDFLEPSEDERENDGNPVESLPFVMQVAEVGLFDCSSTMLRLVHEIMHACGDRFRDARAKLVQEFFCIWLGQEMAKQILNEDLLEMKEALTQYGIPWEEKYFQYWTEELYPLADSLKMLIQAELSSFWNADRGNWTMLQMSDNLIGWLNQKLHKLFDQASLDFCSPERGKFEESFACELLQEILHSRNMLWSKWDAQWKKDYGVIFTTATLVRRKSEFLMEQLSVENPNYSEFNRQMQNYAAFLSDICESKLPYVKDVFHIFGESFSDHAAQFILQSEWVDYLLCFLMEKGDIEQMMPDSFVNQYRIPLVLRSVYGFSGYIRDPENKTVLMEAVHHLQSHNALVQSDAVNALVERVDHLLEKYDQFEFGPQRKVLVEYLCVCMTGFKKYRNMEGYRKIYRSFSEIRRSEKPDTVIQILQAFACIEVRPEVQTKVEQEPGKP